LAVALGVKRSSLGVNGSIQMPTYKGFGDNILQKNTGSGCTVMIQEVYEVKRIKSEEIDSRLLKVNGI
jgi:hypothetical protein